MSPDIGTIETVPIRKVWPKEAIHFTPWLKCNIGELDKALGLGLKNPRSEVGAGNFKIDLVAETDFGDAVIENQYGRSDHRHLGQLVTYFADRDVQLAIWIVQIARPEHVKAVEVLNERGVGYIWMVAVRTIRIEESPPAPLFTVVAAPLESELAKESMGRELSPSEIKKRDFLAALIKQAEDEGIASPFRGRTPNHLGNLHTPARGSNLLYRVAVNGKESRVVVTNTTGKWLGALDLLLAERHKLDKAFARAGLSGKLEWPEQVSGGRWSIRYSAAANWRDDVDPEKLRELNQASAAMKSIFDPHLETLDPGLEDDADDSSDQGDA